MYSKYESNEPIYTIRRVDNADTFSIDNITKWCNENWVDKKNLLLTYEGKLTFAVSRLTGTSYKLIAIKRGDEY